MVIRAGVVGHPIAHSLSPRIHNTWFADYDLPGIYEAVDTHPDDFEKTIRKLMDEGWAGVNVTLPHKQSAYELADIVNPVAEVQEAANLLIFSDGKIIADNTDVHGFSECLTPLWNSKKGKEMPPRLIEQIGKKKEMRAVVLGAGGAAGPIIDNVLFCQETVVINRTKERAEALAERFGRHRVRAGTWDELGELLPQTDFLINTTSLGMKGQPELDVDVSLLPDHAEVYDIVYAPLETKLLRDARASGLVAVGGLRMLVFQAEPSFKAFTGVFVRKPQDILRTLEAELS
ncbi:MAG: shikimate dehydrogenase [Pseudomonadota bacterium]